MALPERANQTAVVRYDPFALMDRLDDDAIVAELEGRIVDVLVYRIKDSTGRITEGLSKPGVDACVREMCKQGEVLRELELEVTENEREYLAKCKVGRYAVKFNPETGETKEVLLDTAFGVKRQAKFYDDGRPNIFAFEQACMKAARNAKFRLIPEDLKQRLIALAKKEGKVHEREEGGQASTPKREARPRANAAAREQQARAPAAKQNGGGDRVKDAYWKALRDRAKERGVSDDLLLRTIEVEILGAEEETFDSLEAAYARLTVDEIKRALAHFQGSKGQG